mmetsp:Transcript_3113/g.8233  ORF Transcript_3113/g.8233 Transcript_3113/m.8233 type:complete len:87 (-) Transcript_3113:1490-1750(-)|eukprot:1158125-Pelagomonas_calceolata.AAC.5
MQPSLHPCLLPVLVALLCHKTSRIRNPYIQVNASKCSTADLRGSQDNPKPAQHTSVAQAPAPFLTFFFGGLLLAACCDPPVAPSPP